jgi:hypothetical protein
MPLWIAGRVMLCCLVPIIGQSGRYCKQVNRQASGPHFADHSGRADSASIVFARSNVGVVGSNSIRGMDVCVRLFCVCVVLCVGRGRRSRKPRLRPQGIRRTDHATPLYPQELALTSPTSGGRSVGIVRSRTKATELVS